MDFVMTSDEMLAGSSHTTSRRLAAVIQWKAALWEKDSIEPAMLRVPIVIIVFILLWGVNIWTLERSAIRLKYLSALSIKSGSLSFVLIWSGFFVIIYSATMTLFSNMLGMTVESGVMIFYVLLFVLLITPSIYGQEIRGSFFRLVRLVFFPANTVSFPEVLLADAMTSMSKIFKDMGVTLVAVYSQYSISKIWEYHEVGMILIALLASLPFWLRVRQCSVQFNGSSEFWVKVPITLNIIKYMTAFPPIWLAAAASLGYFHPDLPLITAAMATFNSLYSFMWDVSMDWGLFTITRNGSVNWRQRHKMAFPNYIYVFAAITNLTLRFSWAANRVPQLSGFHPSHLVLMVELAEVCRRSMWNIFRIEWEVVCQEDRAVKSFPDEIESLVVRI